MALWSLQPWRKVDWRGTSGLPPGRFVAGVTHTSIGDVTVIGVCIPWRNSRTPQNRGNRAVWQDHIEYLDGLDTVLDHTRRSRLIVMGDFNQRIGVVPNRPPDRVRDRLRSVIASRLEIITANVGFQDGKAIDHIAISTDLRAESVGAISNCQDKPKDLSDHFGVFATLTPQSS